MKHSYGTRSTTAANAAAAATTPYQLPTHQNLPPQAPGHIPGGHLTLNPNYHTASPRVLDLSEELTNAEIAFINSGPVSYGASLSVSSGSSGSSLSVSSESSGGSIAVSTSSCSSDDVSVSHYPQPYTGRPLEEISGLPLRYLTYEERNILPDEQIFAQADIDGTPTSSMYASDDEDGMEEGYEPTDLGGEFGELTTEALDYNQGTTIENNPLTSVEAALNARQAEYNAYHQLHINDGLRNTLESYYHIDYLRAKHPEFYKNDDRTEAEIAEMKSFYPEIYADNRKASADDEESVSSSTSSSGRASSADLASGATSQEEDDDLIASLVHDLEREEIDSGEEAHKHKKSKPSDDEGSAPQSPIAQAHDDTHQIWTPGGFFSPTAFADANLGRTPQGFDDLFENAQTSDEEVSIEEESDDDNVLNQAFILEEGEKLPLGKKGDEIDLSGEDALFTPEELAEGF